MDKLIAQSRIDRARINEHRQWIKDNPVEWNKIKEERIRAKEENKQRRIDGKAYKLSIVFNNSRSEVKRRKEERIQAIIIPVSKRTLEKQKEREAKYINEENHRKNIASIFPYRPNGYISSSVCSTLKRHVDVLKDDPERLTTGFMLSLIKGD